MALLSQAIEKTPILEGIPDMILQKIIRAFKLERPLREEEVLVKEREVAHAGERAQHGRGWLVVVPPRVLPHRAHRRSPTCEIGQQRRPRRVLALHSLTFDTYIACFFVVEHCTAVSHSDSLNTHRTLDWRRSLL